MALEPAGAAPARGGSRSRGAARRAARLASAVERAGRGNLLTQAISLVLHYPSAAAAVVSWRNARRSAD